MPFGDQILFEHQVDKDTGRDHVAESAVRAYKIAMTPPMGPVAIVVDDHMQDERVPADGVCERM